MTRKYVHFALHLGLVHQYRDVNAESEIQKETKSQQKKTQIQKTIKSNNWKESGTKFTQKQSAQNWDIYVDKKYLQKQHIKGRE